jgi:glucose/arabinose dehydrogenase
MLRIDVTGVPTYTIPPDNPFVDSSAQVAAPNGAVVTPRPEIWASGLRNPWRWSFDRETGDLWIGDVGQGDWEEINFQSASSTGGENYGWRLMEGAHCYNPPTGCPTAGLTFPVTEYANTGGSAVTGGYVYRGPQTPLVGTYLFGDFGSGTIWGMVPNGTGWTERLLLNTSYSIASFGEDEFGELYVVDYNGGIYRINSPVVDRPYRQFAPSVHGVPEE